MIQTLLERPQEFKQIPFTLKPQQQQTLDKLRTFASSTESFFLLCGYAGTGKSTLIFLLIKELLAQSKRIVLTAPTNKAVGILRKMAASQGIFGVDFLTIHQLLGLGIVRKEQEKVLEQTSCCYLHLYDIIFLDECSMVGTQLWSWIERRFERTLFNHRKLILMGDPAQLNPVGEKRSPVFSITNKTMLTEVVRQAGESPVLDFITECRSCVKNKTDMFLPHSTYTQGNKSNGAFKVKPETLLQYALKTIKREFTSNPDCFRILCWTNKQVNYYNQALREQVYGQTAPRFISGERLITKKPVMAPDGKTVILPTSTEFTIKEVETSQHYGYRVWLLKIVTDDGLFRQIFVLHESENKRYQAELKEKLKSAKRSGFLWRKYYWFKDDIFAEIDNCFALTIHNSQGSTFDEVGLDINDILTRLLVGKEMSSKQKLKEYHRLLYVGTSRCRQRILFVPPISSRVQLALGYLTKSGSSNF
jgi:energy-coupling factor transporter ATP-binding protein EcfA2